MTKKIVIGLLIVGALTALYFLVIEPLGIFSSPAKLVDKKILELKKKAGWGTSQQGFSREEQVRRDAIKELLRDGVIQLSDLTDTSRILIEDKMAEINNNSSWLQTIEDQITNEKKFKDIPDGVYKTAIWAIWSDGKELELKEA